MISIEDRKLFARAEVKARQIKPRVSVIKFGIYQVASTEPGKSYTVTFSKDQDGHWQAECTCKAHTTGKKPLACYHIVAAYAAHKIQACIRKEVRAAQEAAPTPAAIVAQSVREIEEFIAEAQALPDFDPTDIAPEYTEAQAAHDTVCLFG